MPSFRRKFSSPSPNHKLVLKCADLSTQQRKYTANVPKLFNIRAKLLNLGVRHFFSLHVFSLSFFLLLPADLRLIIIILRCHGDDCVIGKTEEKKGGKRKKKIRDAYPVVGVNPKHACTFMTMLFFRLYSLSDCRCRNFVFINEEKLLLLYYVLPIIYFFKFYFPSFLFRFPLSLILMSFNRVRKFTTFIGSHTQHTRKTDLCRH